MRYANVNRGKPYNLPYTYENVPTRGRWTYSNHAQLAFGLIKNSRQAIPQFSNLPDDYTPEGEDAELLGECMRQVVMLAVDREPHLFFAQPERLYANMQAQRGEVSEEIEDLVSGALDEADELVRLYFKEGRKRSPSSGVKMIDEIVEKRHRVMERSIEAAQFRE